MPHTYIILLFITRIYSPVFGHILKEVREKFNWHFKHFFSLQATPIFCILLCSFGHYFPTAGIMPFLSSLRERGYFLASLKILHCTGMASASIPSPSPTLNPSSVKHLPHMQEASVVTDYLWNRCRERQGMRVDESGRMALEMKRYKMKGFAPSLPM